MNTRTLVLSLTLASLLPQSLALAASSPLAHHPASVRYFVDRDGPKAKLANGREYRLLPLTAEQKQALAARKIESGTASDHSSNSLPNSAFSLMEEPSDLPSVVHHRRFYGPIKDQGERNTCTAFATAAAIEGAYRKLDPVRFADLDLSEQWVNHIQKMVDRRRTMDAQTMETALGSWGGAFVHYELLVLRRYGVTDEATMAYNASGAYEAMGQDLQDAHGDPDLTARQIDADDFNLDATRLPVTALEHAPYRPTEFQWIKEAQLRDPAYLEQVLAAGRDVVFSMLLVKDEERTADGAWTPGASKKVVGGHAMLIVGYNREKRYFIVRNQWGPDPDAIDMGDPDGYARISYEYVQRYGYQWAAAVTAVADPSEAQSVERLFLRRWTLPDGGKLDFYRLPKTYSYQDFQEQETRIGTFFSASGHAYRVNGALDGDTLLFAIDRDNPNMGTGQWAPTVWRMTLAADHQSMTISKE